MKTFKYIIGCMLVWLAFMTLNAQSEIISEDMVLMNDSIKLPGTLTYTKSLHSQPLVIFIQGSGNPDRNGNQIALGVKANYIKMLRDSLNRNNIAFYSYDKRNVTASNIALMMKKKFVFEDLVTDAQKAISNFANDNRFSSITIIGHSQGSLVGMLSVNDHVDKYISLAGLGEPVDKAIVQQISNQSEELGATTKSHFKELKETGNVEEPNPMLLSIFAKQNLEFLKSYMNFNPENEIKKLDIPTLIINGTKDIQVSIDDAKRLHNANSNSQLELIDNMNHVLKIIEDDNDNLASYSDPKFRLSQNLVKTISDFIKNND